MTRDEAREYINGQEPTFLQKTRKGYICPACGQGANKGNGITRATGRKHLWHCVAEGSERSVLGLFAIHNGIPDDKEHYLEILDRAAHYYGITIESESHRATAREDFSEEYQNQPKTERYTQNATHTTVYTQGETMETDYKDFFLQAHSHIKETDYPQRRGLSQETIDRFKLGYVAEWRHPKRRQDKLSPRLIIPITRYSYIARYTGEGDFINSEGDEMNKGKAKGKETVSWVFNRQALYSSSKPIFIVEGELDALSIIEVGGEAVALGSTSGVNAFVNLLKEKKPSQPLIIALDNDKAGKEASEKLTTELEKLEIPFYGINPYGDYKDANEALQGNREALRRAVEEAEHIQDEAEQAKKEAYLSTSTANYLQGFIDGITDSVNTPCISTGFPKLDEVLDGGLYEGLYIVGAISSLGKTTLITQIADQIAQSGQDVLIFSLEMARTQLMAKSISRHTLQTVLATGGDIRNAKTSRGITTGKRYQDYNRTELALINSSIKTYSEYAQHIYISEGIGDIGAEQIRETVREHVTFTGNTPVVVVDYVQILAPYNERATDKQNMDKTVLELKRISRDYKLPLIGISSLNRQNYNAQISMEALKETGMLDYGSDVIMGLQLKGTGEKSFDVNEAKKKNPREVELIILKNREAATGGKLNYRYYPMFNYFEEV